MKVVSDRLGRASESIASALDTVVVPAVGVPPVTDAAARSRHGRAEAGQHVLVIGASGGVRSDAVQIAKALGADVTGVASHGASRLAADVHELALRGETRTSISRQRSSRGRPTPPT